MTGSLREAREESERGRAGAAGAGGAPAPVGEAGDDRPDGRRDRPRGGHPPERDRRAGARPRQEGRARRRGRERAGRGVEKNAGIITGEVARITKIIRQVLDFSRQRGPTLTRVKLAAVVAEALEFLGETIERQGIAVDVGGRRRSCPEVPGDPDQIQQVCLNLFMNAIHAMPRGGTLRIATEAARAPQGGPGPGAAGRLRRAGQSPTAGRASPWPTATRSSSRSSPPRTKGRDGPGPGGQPTASSRTTTAGSRSTARPGAGAVFRVYPALRGRRRRVNGLGQWARPTAPAVLAGRQINRQAIDQPSV